MTLTPSTMPALGSTAPAFALPDTAGRIVRRDDFASAKALLVVFWCNHCPYVRHIQQGFVKFARDYAAKPLAVVAINANDIERYPDDSPARMKEVASQLGYGFPYLYDESQQVARAYQAACTPDFFLYDGKGQLAYRGQFDGSRPGNGVAVSGEDLRRAVDAVLAGQPVPGEQRPSIGCNIKWQPGKEP